jgi:hypothetical protein
MGITKIRFHRPFAACFSSAVTQDSEKILGARKIVKKERRDRYMCRAAPCSAAPEFVLAVIAIRLFYSISPL